MLLPFMLPSRANRPNKAQPVLERELKALVEASISGFLECEE
jgi:hypothetical protein